MTVDSVLSWMREHFAIYPESGELIWTKPPLNHPKLMGLSAGARQATHSGKVYVVVKKGRVALKRGRLIFLWVHGRWPEPCVDHINGDSANDGINNLREATITQNAWNHKRRAKRQALPMGVRVNAHSGRFAARIACNKKMITIGTFDTSDEASAAYQAKRKELYHEFA